MPNPNINRKIVTSRAPSALLANMVAYWKLEGNSTDSVGTNNGADTSVTYSAANGKIGQGAGFDGTNSKILVPDSDNWTMGSGDFTVAWWVKRGGGIGARNIFSGQLTAAGSATAGSFFIEFQASNTVRVYFSNSTTFITATSTGTISDTTTYHHIVFVRRTNTIFLYLDNVQDGTGDVTAMTMNNSTANMGIGNGGDFATLFLNGAMDEIGIWKGRGLTASEISTLYNGGFGKQYPF